MRRFAGAVALLAFLGLVAQSQIAQATVYADWTLTGSNVTGSGFPADSSGNGHDFQNNFGGNASFAGSVGGPSSGSSDFNGGQGYYGTVNAGTLPTDNFVLNFWANADSLAQSYLLSSQNPVVGSLQVGLDGAGNWTAWINNAVNVNGSGSTLGTAPAALNTNTQLTVTRSGGIMSLAVNGVPTGVTSSAAFPGFGSIHLAVGPGGSGPNYDGRMSDVTISSVPEPSTVMLAGLGVVGLFVAARRRRHGR